MHAFLLIQKQPISQTAIAILSIRKYSVLESRFTRDTGSETDCSLPAPGGLSGHVRSCEMVPPFSDALPQYRTGRVPPSRYSRTPGRLNVWQ